MSQCTLVVEDEKDNREIRRDLLANAGYELTEAENGEEAIAAIAKRRQNLILMDIQLPIIDGYEATRRIRTNPDLRSVPIIAVTSCALAGDEDKALAAGCDGYVSPYSPRDLLAKIRAYLGWVSRSSHAQPARTPLPRSTQVNNEGGIHASSPSF